MRGVLAGADAGEDVQEVRGFILEAAWNCIQPRFEDLWGAGELYRPWMEMDDILDGWPFDYGDDADALAMREFTLAAREWLDMPRTEAGFRTYVHRWVTRTCAVKDQVTTLVIQNSGYEILIVFVLAQRQFIEGLAHTGLKG
jgi:hypothetical protein